MVYHVLKLQNEADLKIFEDACALKNLLELQHTSKYKNYLWFFCKENEIRKHGLIRSDIK